MAAWLFKTEPTEYAFADLVKDRETIWSGIKNATALIHLRSVKKGDTVVIYHTGTERRAMGLAKVKRGAFPDPALDDPKRVVVELAAGAAFATPVPLGAFRADPVLATSDLLRITRLSVVPLDARQMARVVALARG
jgi:predicted RNA-binding protein with PUA-like domain